MTLAWKPVLPGVRFHPKGSAVDVRALLKKYRRYLTNYESLLAYSLLGLAGGIASGLVVLGFELAIGSVASLWGVGNGGEDFESLPMWAHFALPAGGALLLGGLYALLKPGDRETGIVHVISGMHSRYGALPFRNALEDLQFTRRQISNALFQLHRICCLVTVLCISG